MASLFDTVSQQLTSCLSASRWLVAYSGGLDSHVLLHTVNRYLQQQGISSPTILAVHINHQLHLQSDEWQSHCQQQAKQLAVPCYTEAVDVNCAARESLEEKARQARYSVFESLIEPGDVLLLGHHLDDQVETLLMRLLRGSGSRGVAGIPRQRSIGLGQLLRPMLDVARADIEQYALQHQLHWVEDPSNQSSDYDRNFLRLALLPLVAQRWPEYRQTLSRAAALSEESARLNDDLAAVDFHGLGLATEQSSIPLAGLRKLDHARQKNLLRYWLRNRRLALPSAQQLQAVLATVVAARQDAEPLVQWSGVQARRFKDTLYIMSSLQVLSTEELAATYQWDVNNTIFIGGVGELSAKLTHGKGISVERLRAESLEVRFRRGGERCRPAGRSASQTLKKLFQEYAIEPWLRDRVPLLYCNDELVAVADLWVCQQWQTSQSEHGWSVCWHKVN